ncbi:AraC family transcriptional regulator [Vibrio sonorensis]|uniref:AraC family transcriptional regulator n=1 Tax=Vibrio sonorensis TaxID=1004316 RepID=UPI0008DA94AB|nr:GyrI-like domain-containing protein [Vibrio sonorensis]
MLSSVSHHASSIDVYKQRLIPVLNHVHTHPDQPLSLAQAAELSHFSKFHFQRIFSAIMGESLTSYANRARLEMAANCLLFSTNTSVTDVAMQYGFSSSANFTRSFKEHFGVTPAGIRSSKKFDVALNQDPLKVSLDTQALQHVHRLQAEVINPSTLAQPIKIVQVEEKTLCTLRSTGGYDLPAIYRSWEDMINWGYRNNITNILDVRYGLGFDNPVFTPREKCRYEAALEIPESLTGAVSPPFKLGKIQGGEYAIFEYKGTQKQILKFQIALYTQWMPYSGYEPDNVPLIEHYTLPIKPLDECGCQTNIIEMQIWLKLRKLRQPTDFSY